MGRNIRDFFGDVSNPHFESPNPTPYPGTPKVTKTEIEGLTSKHGRPVKMTRAGNELVASTNASQTEVRRKVTRNRDVKKQGNRIAKVAAGTKSAAKKDKVTNYV